MAINTRGLFIDNLHCNLVTANAVPILNILRDSESNSLVMSVAVEK